MCDAVHIQLSGEICGGGSVTTAQTLTALTASPISGGLHQSCVAAPHLFNGITDHLMSWVCGQIPGVLFASYKLTDLLYADDTILLSTVDCRSLSSSLGSLASKWAGQGPSSCMLVTDLILPLFSLAMKLLDLSRVLYI